MVVAVDEVVSVSEAGDEVVVELLDDELSPLEGDAVVERLVVLLVLEEEPPPAGEGFTMVVLCSVAGDAPPAAGVTSVRCSQPARRAALARIQMDFFIIL